VWKTGAVDRKTTAIDRWTWRGPCIARENCERRERRVEEAATMSSTLNETVKHGVESVREGTEHTLASTLSAMVKGVSTVSAVVTMLRGLDRDDGLAWLGLARRRPLRAAAMFSAGLALGAGFGVLFAPMSGADLRRTLLGRPERKEQAEVANGDGGHAADDTGSNNAPGAAHAEAGRPHTVSSPS
jgi:hypothetical protein